MGERQGNKRSAIVFDAAVVLTGLRSATARMTCGPHLSGELRSRARRTE